MPLMACTHNSLVVMPDTRNLNHPLYMRNFRAPFAQSGSEEDHLTSSSDDWLQSSTNEQNSYEADDDQLGSSTTMEAHTVNDEQFQNLEEGGSTTMMEGASSSSSTVLNKMFSSPATGATKPVMNTVTGATVSTMKTMPMMNTTTTGATMPMMNTTTGATMPKMNTTTGATMPMINSTTTGTPTTTTPRPECGLNCDDISLDFSCDDDMCRLREKLVREAYGIEDVKYGSSKP